MTEKDFESLNQKTLNESKEESKNFKDKSVTLKFMNENEKQYFIKKILQLVSDENIVELQNILKNDTLKVKKIKHGNTKYRLFSSLIEVGYINSLEPTIYEIGRIELLNDNVLKANIILNSIPTLTNEGFKELERLKEIYKD